MDLGSLVAVPAGITFGVASRLRRARPLHPKGWLADATLALDGTAATGVPLLDDASRRSVLVRMSKAVGLPGASPDVLGLALRIPAADGDADLLLATTGMSPGLRHLLLPGLDWASAYSTLVPFETSRGLLLLGLVPRSRVFAPPSLRTLALRLGGRDLDFDVVVATPRGPWRPVGALEVRGPVRGDDDALRFDPFATPAGAQTWAPVVRALRRGAYGGSRAGWPGVPAAGRLRVEPTTAAPEPVRLTLVTDVGSAAPGPRGQSSTRISDPDRTPRPARSRTARPKARTREL